MKEQTYFATGLGMGAGLMYLLDQNRGRTRRARLRDQMVHQGHRMREGVGTAGRDSAHRLQGLVAELRSGWQGGDASDSVVEARVRSKIGRLVSHPRAITVRVSDGRVTLTGPILADEVRPLISTLSALKGVRGVDNQLDVHTSEEGISSLQGGRRRPDQLPGVLDERWPPALRMAALIAGGVALTSAVRLPRPAAVPLGLLGSVLLTRGLFNLDPRHVVGVGARDHAIHLQKTLTINAPVEDVYGFFTRFDRYPLCMEHVRKAERTGEDRWRMTFAGPAGIPVTAEAIVTEDVPNERFSWQSTGHSPVRESGKAHFQSENDGQATRVDFHMAYTPPAGAIGHGIAALLGADPKHAFDDDLVRVKSLLENGKTTAHGKKVTREEVLGE